MTVLVKTRTYNLVLLLNLKGSLNVLSVSHFGGFNIKSCDLYLIKTKCCTFLPAYKVRILTHFVMM